MSNTTMTDSKPQPEPVKSELSPAAQAVLDAYINAPCGKPRSVWVAAALRAAADQCKIEWNYHPDYPETESVIVVSDLLAIAAELEAQAN
jgi:hypothetical protein